MPADFIRKTARSVIAVTRRPVAGVTRRAARPAAGRIFPFLRLDSREFSSLYSTKLNSGFGRGPPPAAPGGPGKPKCDRKGGLYAKEYRCSVRRRRLGVGDGVY